MLFRRMVAALGALVLLCCSVTAVRAQGDDSRYERLAERYFNENFAAQPVSATITGVHAYDAMLGSYAAADWRRQFARDRRYLALVEKIDPGTLSPETALDRTMFENSLHDDLLVNEAMASWQHKPDSYVQIVSGGIFGILSRAFAPAPARLRFVIARENDVARVLAQARANLTTVDKESADLAVDDAGGTASFLATTVPLAFAGVGTTADRTRFRASTAASVAAVNAYAAYVKSHFVANPQGTYAIGAANYSDRLRYEEAITMPLDAYLKVGEDALAATHAAMVATAKQIDPSATPMELIARIAKEHHPTAETLIPQSQADLVQLRAFILAHHIIDLPSDAAIRVTLTPEFERETTIASMDAPGPLEKVATQAYYNVTPVNPKDSAAAQETYLETFNDFERPIVSAHEVYPGHFTQYVIDKHLPLSLTKKLLGASSFVEGWAHYDEQMMVDEGWGDGDPRVRLMQLREAILRNARYVVGVKLHTQGMTLAEAEQFFREQGFQDPVSARIEARRGTQDATYGYYTLGKLEILKLRDDYKKKMGDKFSLAAFHAALLAHGSPPIPLLRPILLGDADDGKIL